MSRMISFATGEYYHLYNRGVDKRTIYLTAADYARFSALLYVANNSEAVHLDKLGRGSTSPDVFLIERKATLVEIGAYCLMPNHFHLLVKEATPGGISKFMQKICTGYTMYFNTLHDRTGALFQGKFQAEHISEDRYLKYLLAYIHLNPVKLIQSDWKEVGLHDFSAAEKYLYSYSYSSFLDHLDHQRPEAKILNFDSVPSYFPTISDMEAEIRNWLLFK